MAITKLPSTASRAATRPAASRSCWPGVSSDALLACCMTKWHFLTSNPLSLSPLQARQQEVLAQITNILKVVALDAELAHSHLEKAEAVSSYAASGGLRTKDNSKNTQHSRCCFKAPNRSASSGKNQLAIPGVCNQPLGWLSDQGDCQRCNSSEPRTDLITVFPKGSSV